MVGGSVLHKRAWVQDACSRVVFRCEKKEHVNAGPGDIDRGLRVSEGPSYREAGCGKRAADVADRDVGQ